MTKTLALLLALTTAMPAAAGGVVIVEDAYETEAPRDDRKIGGLVVGLIVIGAILALSNGGSACQGPDDVLVDPVPPTNGCR